MPWSASSSSSATSIPRPSRTLAGPASPSTSGVTARLQASRNAEYRASASPQELAQAQRANQVRNIVFGGDQRSAGLLYEHADEIQSELQRKKRTAGPVAPPSWRRQQATSSQSNKGKQRAVPSPFPSQQVFRPTNLKEECLCFLLKDLATDCHLIDEIPWLPSHLKDALIQLAPRVAPLDDISAEALLLDGIESGGELQELIDDWERVAAGTRGFVATSEVSTSPNLDLSYSSLSLPVLRRIVVEDPDVPPEKWRRRLMSLTNLDLSHNTGLSLGPSLVSIFSCLSLSSLSLCDISYSLASPLEALASELPSLRHLDISQNPWLQWDHLSQPDWSKHWTGLQTLNIVGCEGLSPQASYLDPEGKGGGPAVVVQAMGLLRERGRRKWLDILA